MIKLDTDTVFKTYKVTTDELMSIGRTGACDCCGMDVNPALLVAEFSLALCDHCYKSFLKESHVHDQNAEARMVAYYETRITLKKD